jgi:hypothetical protein
VLRIAQDQAFFARPLGIDKPEPTQRRISRHERNHLLKPGRYFAHACDTAEAASDARSSKITTWVSASGACIDTEDEPLATDHPAGAVNATPSGVVRGVSAVRVCMFAVDPAF